MEYEDVFFQVDHAKCNWLKLVRKNVITENIASRTSATTDDESRELLYHHLKHHGSVQTLREFCEVVVAADGYPNMQKLAEKILHAIPTDGYWCMCDWCVYLCSTHMCGKHTQWHAVVLIMTRAGGSRCMVGRSNLARRN